METSLGLIVDWTKGELRPAPRKNRPNRRETFYPATCPVCQATRFLRKSDARKGSPCRSCHSREAGRKGYQVTVSRHGQDFALECVRNYRLDHPSAPERELAQFLASQGIRFEREFRFDGQNRKYLLDFIIRDGDGSIAFAIEIDGWHHFHQPERMDRDRSLDRELPFPLVRMQAENLNFDFIRESVVPF